MSGPRAIRGRIFRVAIFAAVAGVCASLPAQAPQTPPAQTCAGESKQITELSPGVTWTHLCTIGPANPNAAPAVGKPLGAPAGPWSIHVLEIMRHRRDLAFRTRIGMNDQGQLSRVPLTQLAAEAIGDGENVLAAINGDFDMPDPYLGIPTGLAVTNGKVWTAGGPPRPAFATFTGELPGIGIPEISMTLNDDGTFLPIDTLNKPMDFSKDNNLRIYTGAYQSEVKAKEPFRAAIVKRLYPPPPLPVHGIVRGVVTEIRKPATVQTIPYGAILVAESAEGKTQNNYLRTLEPGHKVILGMWIRMKDRGDIQDAAGGFPILITNGKISLKDQGDPGDYLKPRHPRTAACYNEDKIIFVVVDGRQPDLSIGMTLEELANLMLSLGCTEAMNTDGGGSTELLVAIPKSVQRLTIVNSPSDGHERGRPNAWLLVKSAGN